MNSLIDAILLAILAGVHAHPLRMSRSSVIDRRIIAAVDPGGLLVRKLFLRAPDVLFVHRGTFASGRRCTDAALAVEAVMIVVNGGVIYKSAILVHAVEANAHVPRRCVVSEGAAFPASAPETNAAVAEAVINSAVESDVRSPVAPMPA